MGPHLCKLALTRGVELGSVAKVGNLEVAGHVQQDVLGLDVPVHVAHHVQVVDAQGNLND